MSPFVILKRKLQEERDGVGGAPTTDEPTRVDAIGSDSASLEQALAAEPGGGALVHFSAPGEASLQSP